MRDGLSLEGTTRIVETIRLHWVIPLAGQCTQNITGDATVGGRGTAVGYIESRCSCDS